MEFRNMFRSSSSPGDGYLVAIFHKIAPIIVLAMTLFAVCFVFTLLSMLIIQGVLELMLRMAELVFGHNRGTQELIELENGMHAFRSRRTSPFVLYNSRPMTRRLEGREELMVAAENCSSIINPCNDIDQLLPLVAYKDGVTRYMAGDHCAICLDDYSDGEFCRVLSTCSHMFHSHCVDPWFRKSLTCPVCRQFIFKK